MLQQLHAPAWRVSKRHSSRFVHKIVVEKYQALAVVSYPVRLAAAVFDVLVNH